MGRILLVAVLLTIGFLGIAAGLNYLNDHKEHILVMGAGEKGSDSYVFGQAISRLAKRYDPKLRIIVAETAGSIQNDKMMEDGHLQLAADLADTPMGDNARLVAILYPDTYQLLICEESGIKTMEDIRGKTIALPGIDSGEQRSFEFLMRHFQIKPSEVEIVNMSTTSAAWALESRAVDAIFKVRAPGNDQLAEIIQSGGISIAPIPQSRALKLEEPAIRQGLIPAGSYSGSPAVPDHDLETPMVDRVLIASSDVSDDIIARLSQLIYNYRREMADQTPLAGFLAGEAELRNSSIPLHDGVETFLSRDDPSFIQENAEVMAFYVTLLAGLISLMINLNNRRQKERVDAFNRELIDVYNSAVDDPEPSIVHYRNRMMDIFSRVIRDFENGAVTSNGFEFLSFAWDELNDAVIALVEHKSKQTSVPKLESGS